MESCHGLTLLIMAAGLGSRFGGLKQLEPVGKHGELIIDYSIYDAKKAGFQKVVCIIRKENLELFEETIGKRIGKQIPLEYVFQEDTLTYHGKEYKREKPWGTAHAIYAARKAISGDFLVINADDFYGRESYLSAIQFLKQEHASNEFAFVGYKTINTLTENGAVKRGICKIEHHFLKEIVESSVALENGEIIARPLDGTTPFSVAFEDTVSMNMFVFTPYIFDLIEEFLGDFLESVEDLEKWEYLIPDVVEKAITTNKVTVKELKTEAKWQGVTYKEDKSTVVEGIEKLVRVGVYPENLWEN